MKSEVPLSTPELEYIFTPKAIRDRAKVIFERTEKRKGHFRYHPEKLEPTVKLVLDVIKKKYPDLNIPFHSRWGHFRAGGVDRVKELNEKLARFGAIERVRCKLDLVITSVLLDAGAGPAWKYRDGTQLLFRSEGLGVASLRMFLAGAMSSDGQTPRVDAQGLEKLKMTELMTHFQTNERNPLVGVEGRLGLLKSLGKALSNGEIFGTGRPGHIYDCLRNRFGESIPATGILRVVLEGLGPIWPGRMMCKGVNLGDTWRHSALDPTSIIKSLVPFHKLSQWLTYSMIEPILEAGVPVTGVEELTGLAEYRNGGLFLDSGLISLKDPADAERDWKPENDLIIEWRALTIHLLDLVGAEVQKALKKSPADFPLAKVLEGGTWWAGRQLAEEKRKDGVPPLNIVSDGTVF
ncbi:MAG TPA: URC4/urg3 family protein [Bdellovibrionota bacterium]